MLLQQFNKVEWGGDAHVEGILELLVCTLVNALHQWQGIVYDAVDPVMSLEYMRDESLKYLFACNVAGKVVATLLLVYHLYCCTRCAELAGNTFANAVCSACHNHHFVLECAVLAHMFLLCIRKIFLFLQI